MGLPLKCKVRRIQQQIEELKTSLEKDNLPSVKAVIQKAITQREKAIEYIDSFLDKFWLKDTEISWPELEEKFEINIEGFYHNKDYQNNKRDKHDRI
jgi:hypothetical protein